MKLKLIKIIPFSTMDDEYIGLEGCMVFACTSLQSLIAKRTTFFARTKLNI